MMLKPNIMLRNEIIAELSDKKNPVDDRITLRKRLDYYNKQEIYEELAKMERDGLIKFNRVMLIELVPGVV